VTPALREAAAGVIDLLFPPVCLVCRASGPPFCESCREGVRPVPDLAPPPGVGAVRSAGSHEGALRSAVLALKFARKTALAAPLAELLAEELARCRLGWRPDLLLPVPIHWLRRLERGFNQSELLAAELGRRAELPVSRALARRRATPPQVGTAGPRRVENVRDAFAVRRRGEVEGRRVVLVDDVWTTGATLAECARTLRAAGAGEVCAVTVTHQGES
jgi:ComF family protein